MTTIMVNPDKLSELYEYYNNNYDARYRRIVDKFEDVTKRLAGSWEGVEAERGNRANEKIKASLQRIVERSNNIKRILMSKVEGFNDTMDEARARFDDIDTTDNINF